MRTAAPQFPASQQAARQARTSFLPGELLQIYPLIKRKDVALLNPVVSPGRGEVMEDGDKTLRSATGSL